MAALCALRGVEAPTASVLLHFAFPDRYPIIDWRALESLGEPAQATYPIKYWLSYAAACRKLAEEASPSCPFSLPQWTMGRSDGGHGASGSRRSKTSSNPSIASSCSPTCWKPNERAMAREGALCGLMEATHVRARPVAHAHSSSARIPSRA